MAESSEDPKSTDSPIESSSVDSNAEKSLEESATAEETPVQYIPAQASQTAVFAMSAGALVMSVLTFFGSGAASNTAEQINQIIWPESQVLASCIYTEDSTAKCASGDRKEIIVWRKIEQEQSVSRVKSIPRELKDNKKRNDLKRFTYIKSI